MDDPYIKNRAFEQYDLIIEKENGVKKKQNNLKKVKKMLKVTGICAKKPYFQ